MRPPPLNATRILVVVAFSLTCFGLFLFLWNAFGGDAPLKPKGYRVTVALPQADLLSTQADVRISGVTVGRVVSSPRNASAADPNRKDALLEIDPEYAPLHGDVRAIVRMKSLAGEEYLELTPGTPATPAIPDGGRLPGANVAASVKIDEVLRAFDPATRRAFGTWVQEQGASFSGRGADVNQALGALPAFEQDLTEVLATLNRQTRAVRAAVRSTGTVFDALSERDGALRGLIVNGERVTDVLARRGDAIAATFRALPTFEDESRRLLERADRFRLDTDPVLTALRPGFRDFSAAAVELPGTAKELNGLVQRVPALNAAGERGLPAARTFVDEARPLLAQFVPFLGQLQPALAYIGPNADTLNTLVANLAALTQPVAAGYGSQGEGVHYLRAGMALQPDGLALYPRRQPDNRSNPYDSGAARFGAAQPYTVFDDRHCSQPLTFPKLGPADADAKLPAELMDRIRHFVLNDDQPIAPPCLLQKTPGSAFPQVAALSQTPRGAP
ncbi:MAG TPA: MlaD family protein [Baekduia sp.]|uniref:MlaD family protein n=1 Tax=Baekduia sp. TaxID=2600305 RepID=UPI002BD2698C|nr:MlaD family protein [Baekduia sp.]HMJ35441.1 MlaD family protein [Baekduia sp.]